jgi:hypothetical protein
VIFSVFPLPFSKAAEVLFPTSFSEYWRAFLFVNF